MTTLKEQLGGSSGKALKEPPAGASDFDLKNGVSENLGLCSNHRKLVESVDTCEECLSSMPEFEESPKGFVVPEELGMVRKVGDNGEETITVAGDCSVSLLKKAEANQVSVRSANGVAILLPFLASDIHRPGVLHVLSCLIIENVKQAHPEELGSLVEILKSGMVTSTLGHFYIFQDDAKCDAFRALWRILGVNLSAQRIFGDSTGFSLLFTTLHSFQNIDDLKNELPVSKSGIVQTIKLGKTIIEVVSNFDSMSYDEVAIEVYVPSSKNALSFADDLFGAGNGNRNRNQMYSELDGIELYDCDTVEGSFKKMGPHRRRYLQKLFGCHSSAESQFSGMFWGNIRQFLRPCAEPEDYILEGMPIWCTFLVYESRGTVLQLYTVEEVMHSDRPFCDYCRCAGWSHRFVTKKKYHMINPAKDEWNKFLDEGVFDLQTHLLHGLIHSNGFGHSIRITGIKRGSEYICNKEIMDLWDRICTVLHARQIFVEDLSTKRKIDLWLLHEVAYGHSWFSKWGYWFCHGRFGVKDHNYERAMDVLGSLKLHQVIKNFSLTKGCTMVKQMIDFYRRRINADLIAVRDLFGLVLSLKPLVSPITFSAIFPSWPGKQLCTTGPLRLSLGCSSLLQSRCPSFRREKPSKCRKFSTLAANMDCSWPVRRLEHVAVVIVDALKEKKAASKDGKYGMTRQEARDAVRLHIGDTGLIDHVLKVMNNVIIENYVVRRAVNRSTKVLEYTLQDLKGSKGAAAAYLPMRAFTVCPGRSISSDIAYLYKNRLLGYPIDMVKFAAQAILHSKHFVKKWPFRD